MWNLKLYPYKVGSESATSLAQLLDILRVKAEGTYVPKIGHKVINWGNGKIPNWVGTATQRGVIILNKILIFYFLRYDVNVVKLYP